MYLLLKLLLPTAGKKRVYNLQSKQLVKLLSQVCEEEGKEEKEKGGELEGNEKWGGGGGEREVVGRGRGEEKYLYHSTCLSFYFIGF